MPLRSLSPVLAAALLAGCTPKPAAPAAVTKANRPASPAPARAVPAPARPAAELVRKGIRAYESGDALTAVRSFEAAVAADPNNRKALWHLALIRGRQAGELPRPQNSPVHLQVAAILRRLRAAYPTLTPEERAFLPRALYNEACTFSLDGEYARALGSLNEAIDAGFVDVAQIEADSDLDNLRRLPDFQNIHRRLEQRIVQALIGSSKPYPFDFRLSDLDGKPVKHSDFKGKVLIVCFWGTWNSPGRKMAPLLADLSRRLHDRGLEVVGLAYENEAGDPALKAVRAFAKEAGLSYPCLIGDDAKRVADFVGYPTTLFLDRGGEVRLKLNGYQPLSTLEAAALSLLGEGRPKAKVPPKTDVAGGR